MKFALREASPEIKVAVLGLAVLFGVAAFSRGADDAIDAANAARAQRGLPPFQRDEGLTAAAVAAADFRAAYLIQGHSANDFQFLPAGTVSPAAGCAAWPDGMGFGSCCLYENWTFAGAASARGADGRLYHHLFVSHQGRASAKPVAPAAPACPAGGCAPASVYHSERHTVVHREGVVMPVANVVGFFQTRQPAREFVRRLAGRR